MEKTLQIHLSELREEIAQLIEGYKDNALDEHCKNILKQCAKFARGQSS